MKLVGKKLYRIGPLKLFKQNYSAPAGNPSGNPRYGGTGTGSSGPTEEQKRRQREFQEAMKKKQWLAEQAKQSAAIEKGEWKKESMKDLYDPEQQALFLKQKKLAEEVGSGAAARRQAEAGMQANVAQMKAQGGQDAQRLRALQRAMSTGQRAAAAQGAGSAAQQAKMLGAAGAGRFGMMKSDKAGKLGFYQKSRGLDVAEKAAEKQAAATRAANQGGKASGGEIYKEFKRKNGKIEGKGTETSDDVKAMLSDGEFVVNAKTVRGLGESMGAKGKEDSRKKGAGFLYDLQTKYGDKKPVNKEFGGLEIADLASHAAKEGAFGKKMKTVGAVGSAAVGAKKGLDKKKADDLKTSEDKEWKDKVSKQLKFKKGGHVNHGKGVKAARKFREAIGWEADKIFDKKAEKDYKEGHTGYKNWKGDSVLKLGRGGFLGSIGRVGLGALSGAAMTGGNPVGAIVGGAKAAMSEKAAAEKEKKQKKANIAMGEAEALSKKAEAAQASEDVELKDGGAVKKRRSLLKQLDDYDKRHKMGKYKPKPIDLSPEKKSWEAIRAKKGSVEPVEMKKGGVPRESFDQTFARAREKGLKTFMWNGKEYGTKLAKGKKGFRDQFDEKGHKAFKAHKKREEVKKGRAARTKAHPIVQKAMKEEEDKKKARIKAKRELEEYKETAHPMMQARKLREARLNVEGAEDKEVKDKDAMSGSDKAQIALGVGKGLLSARAQYLKDKQDRAQALARGLRIAEGTRAAAGRQLIAAPVSLRKGGRVSFKDVLKAKKKMGY